MTNILHELLRDIPVPRMVRIRQKFDHTKLDDPVKECAVKMQQSGVLSAFKPGQEVAIAVGSRGISNLAEVTKEMIDQIKSTGAKPFIVPSMGSHGGATAKGQVELLNHLGISEQSMGVPIRSSMEVVKIDQLENGLPVYIDKYAYEADAIAVINRVKPHTAFRWKIESGIMKMIAIGLGKQKGAEACHQLGFKYMGENVVEMANIMLRKLPIVFGLALVENAYDETCRLEVLPAAEIEKKEAELLEEAKARLPQILFDQIDVLVIDYIGKNISGDGMDPNVTGRYPTPYAHGGPDVSKMVVLDLTKETEGNANGMGTADFATQRLVDKTDLPATYANGLTSTVCEPTKIATTLPNDLLAIQAAVKTCNILDYTTCRMVRIKDTLHLGEIEISETMLEDAKNVENIEVISEPYELKFDDEGNLAK